MLVGVRFIQRLDNKDQFRQYAAARSLHRLSKYMPATSNWLLSQSLRAQLSTNLSTFQWQVKSEPTLRRAAVVLLITNKPDSENLPCIILTRRPAKLNQHSGQYALPGGKLDQNETVFEAALRELDEELGVSLDQEQVLGRLDDYVTRSGFIITPVILWGNNNLILKPSEDEVAEVFYIPFSELDSEAIPILEQGVEQNRPVLCSEFPTLGHRMYSPTASIVYQFREVAMRGNSTRVSHFDQPKFAWK